MTVKENTKTKIIKASMKLIQQRGFNGFSFSDVAEIVGIKKASIFYYFSQKEELVSAVLSYYSKDFFVRLNTNSSDNNLENILNNYCELYANNLKNDNCICLCSMLALESFGLGKQLITLVNDFFKQNIKWISDQLLNFGFSEKASHSIAQHFFIAVQGTQLIAKNCCNSDYFMQNMKNEIKNIVNKYEN
ncbi:TetR/AcrR family transcriptional regulator [Apilactobacillus xinyiensis]|uniref:TetR/AcrR family transcriptional regulator n=1 Tax=Apilactobacillus xinyiensis TaxID=2841032 RepID=UPI00200DDA85|nr:TetR/AcrR family transcriptional regulator [Apilactobacillus xinyiensis]MCL0329863.1 TetR/AcrR family transcriptional regulator [Apilactobacillus xinyiensis]